VGKGRMKIKIFASNIAIMMVLSSVMLSGLSIMQPGVVPNYSPSMLIQTTGAQKSPKCPGGLGGFGIAGILCEKLTDSANKLDLKLPSDKSPDKSQCNLEGAGVLAEPLSKSVFCMPKDDQGGDCNTLQSCPDRPQSEGGGVGKLRPFEPSYHFEPNLHNANEKYCKAAGFFAEVGCEAIMEGLDRGIACTAAISTAEERLCEEIIPPDMRGGEYVPDFDFREMVEQGKIVQCYDGKQIKLDDPWYPERLRTWCWSF
jgi:hypothetical protein